MNVWTVAFALCMAGASVATLAAMSMLMARSEMFSPVMELNPRLLAPEAPDEPLNDNVASTTVDPEDDPGSMKQPQVARSDIDPAPIPGASGNATWSGVVPEP